MPSLTDPALLLLLFPVLLTVAALKDLSSFTIPNWISGVLLAGFFPAAWAVGLPWELAAQNAAVGGAALVIGMAMFALNWIGGGDAKLFSASALWLGLSGAMPYLLATAIAGGGLTLGLLAARKAAQYLPPAGPAWVVTLLSPKGDVPYGVALAVGALMAFPQSGLFQAAF